MGLLSQNPSLATPTPSGYGFPKAVTEEQMNYVKGFEEALQKMHQEEVVAGDTVTAANTLVTLSASHQHHHSLPDHPPPPPPPPAGSTPAALVPPQLHTQPYQPAFKTKQRSL